MPRTRRIFADGRLTGGTFSDALIVAMGEVCLVKFAGIAALDPTTGTVAGYEPHNGTFAPDALELQVADVFSQAERLMEAVSNELERPLTFADLTEALVFLRGDYPLAFQRFNHAYAEEFEKRGVGQYPVRTTVMKVTLPEPSALVEIRFEAVVEK